jgi:peptidylprolyl isomerase
MRKLLTTTLTSAALIAGLTGCTATSGDSNSTSSTTSSTTSSPATRATGTPVTPPAGFPTVTLDETGKPTVTIPDTTPPATTKVAVLKQGDGATVKDGDSVTVQYQGVNWDTKKVFDQSWGREPATFATTGVIKGFQDALVGQKVGSQVIAVIPPADGYGPTGQPAAGIKGTDTLVFVIDILTTAPTK